MFLWEMWTCVCVCVCVRDFHAVIYKFCNFIIIQYFLTHLCVCAAGATHDWWVWTHSRWACWWICSHLLQRWQLKGSLHVHVFVYVCVIAVVHVTWQVQYNTSPEQYIRYPLIISRLTCWVLNDSHHPLLLHPIFFSKTLEIWRSFRSSCSVSSG